MSKTHPPRRTFRLHQLALIFTALSLALTPAFAIAAAPSPVELAPEQAHAAQWLVMIYSAADDNVLEQDMMIDLQEAELVGSSDDVTIVVQTDRYDGGYDGMGDWTTTKRFLIEQDDDMEVLASTELDDLGETNMGDGETLKDSSAWAASEYPAEKRMLILSDHGAGWPGGWGDSSETEPGDSDVVLSEMFGDSLWLMEMSNALQEVRDDLGIDYFDVIGFDACLMAQLEVFSAMAPHALYAVASEETEPALGWSYAAFLGQLSDDPNMDGATLATAVVDTYIDQDMRLSDPSYVGDMSPEEAAAEIFPETTLAAIDLGAIAPLNAALDNFVGALANIDQNTVAEARAYAQSYESVFGDDTPSPYIDLGNFAQLIQESSDDPAMLEAIDGLEQARANAVIAERHGDERPGSTGIAIYFPVQDLYEIGDDLGYNDVASQFATDTHWDEFLAFHLGDAPASTLTRPTSPLQDVLQQLIPDIDSEYVSVLEDEIARQIEEGATEDEIALSLQDEWQIDEEVTQALLDAGLLGGGESEAAAPVNDTQRKPLQLSPITLSAEVAYPDEPVSIEATLEGDRVGYVYSFIGRLLPEDDILIIEDQDFIFADDEKNVGGVVYPQWPDGSFTVGFDWEPTVYAISDGESSIRTLFSPDTYGEEPTYTVDGVYHFSDGSPDRFARLYFDNGEMSQVFSFTGSETSSSGAPAEIKPVPGDEFTVLTQGYYEAEDAEETDYSAEAGTLTFGEAPFYIEETPAPSGNYIVGIQAEDLDGNLVESYEGLFVVGEDEVTEEGFVPLVDEDLGFALLHPETWSQVDEGEGRVTLTTEDEAARMIIQVFEYPDAADDIEANQAALDDMTALLEGDTSLEDLEVVGGPTDYVLGNYDAQMIDLAFTYDGTPYAVEVVAATPIQGVTYVVYFESPADQAEDLLYDLDAVLWSFDILLSGIDRTVAGAAQPEFDEVIFEDDYSDNQSGLYDDAEPQDWGQGYYDVDSETYVYALEAASGAIYDYYEGGELDDAFLMQVSSQSAGTVDTGYGLVFQLLDDDHFYAFLISGDGYFTVQKATDGDLSTLVDWMPVDNYDDTEEAVNTIAVAGNGESYALYVNGEQVGEFSDDEFSGGTIGFMVENYDEEAPAAIVFDDLTVGTPAE